MFTNTLSRYENIVYFSQADFVRPARRRANTGQRNQPSSRNTGTDGDQNGSAAERLSEMQECGGRGETSRVKCFCFCSEVIEMSQGLLLGYIFYETLIHSHGQQFTLLREQQSLY